MAATAVDRQAITRQKRPRPKHRGPAVIELHSARVLMRVPIALAAGTASLGRSFGLSLGTPAVRAFLAAGRIFSAATSRSSIFAGPHAGFRLLPAATTRLAVTVLCILMTTGHVFAVFCRLLATGAWSRTGGWSRRFVRSGRTRRLGPGRCCQSQDQSKHFDFHKYLRISMPSLGALRPWLKVPVINGNVIGLARALNPENRARSQWSTNCAHHGDGHCESSRRRRADRTGGR